MSQTTKSERKVREVGSQTFGLSYTRLHRRVRSLNPGVRLTSSSSPHGSPPSAFILMKPGVFMLGENIEVIWHLRDRVRVRLSRPKDGSCHDSRLRDYWKCTPVGAAFEKTGLAGYHNGVCSCRQLSSMHLYISVPRVVQLALTWDGLQS